MLRPLSRVAKTITSEQSRLKTDILTNSKVASSEGNISQNATTAVFGNYKVHPFTSVPGTTGEHIVSGTILKINLRNAKVIGLNLHIAC
jgi:hypothetical protein